VEQSGAARSELELPASGHGAEVEGPVSTGATAAVEATAEE